MPFTFTVEGVERLRAAAEEAPKSVAANLQRAVLAGVAEIVKQTQRGRGIVPYRTGRLSKSIGRLPGGLEIRPLLAIVRPNTDYAYGVHEGNPPHEIRPKNGQALHWPGARHPVKVVKHPGNKGNPFMPALLEAARPDIERHFREAIERSLEGLGS